MSRLRIVSYNIHKGRSGVLSRARFNELRLGLHNLSPDLVFLQEVQGRNERLGLLHAQHESLAAALRLEVAYGCNAVRRHTDHGNALLSRFPIIDHENQDISDHALEQRGLLHARVRIRDHVVHCFVVHLGLFAVSRARQVQAIGDRIEAMVPEHAPILIAGDFNDWNHSLSSMLIERLNVHEVFASAPETRGAGLPPMHETVRALSRVFRDVRNGGTAGRNGSIRLGLGSQAVAPRPPRTFPAAMPWLRLDRIYQRGFAVRSARVLRGRPWVGLSDHVPLVTDLELP